MSWRSRFLCLWRGQAVSALGSAAFYSLLSVWLTYECDSPALVGWLITAPRLAALVATPFAGRLADRLPHARLLVFSDVASALAVGTLALAFAHDARVRPSLIVALTVVAMVVAAARTLFIPALESVKLTLVPADERARYRARWESIDRTTLVLGPALGAFLLSAVGPALVLALDAVSYAFAAWSTARADLVTTRPPSDAPITGHPGWPWRDQGLRRTLLVATLVNAAVAPLGLLLPFLARDRFHLELAAAGALATALGLGGLLGALYCAHRGPPKIGASAVVLVMATALLAAALAPTWWLACLALMAFSGAALVVNVDITVRLQEGATPETVGRVFAAAMMIAHVATPVSLVVGSYLLTRVAPEVLLMAQAIALLPCARLLIPITNAKSARSSAPCA